MLHPPEGWLQGHSSGAYESNPGRDGGHPGLASSQSSTETG